MLQLTCSWCGKLISTVDAKAEGISHGICKSCHAKIKKGLKKKEVKI